MALIKTLGSLMALTGAKNAEKAGNTIHNNKKNNFMGLEQATEKFISLCQKVKTATTLEEHISYANMAIHYSHAILDYAGVELWAKMIVQTDNAINYDGTETVCGVPCSFKI